MEAKTSANNKLIPKLTEPDKRIIHDWPVHEKKTIEAFCQKKIADFESNDFNRFEAKLIMIQKFVGAKDFLSDPEMEMLIEYLTDEFHYYSIEEIEQAVRLAVAERIVSETGKSLAEHYNEFGANYLTKILKAFFNYRGTVVRKYYEGEAALIEADKLKQQKPWTDAEKRQINIRFALGAFENHKTASPTFGLDKVFDFLQNEAILEVAPEKWEQYRQTAMAALKHEAKRGNSIASSVLQTLNNNQNSNEGLTARIKTLAIRAYFELILAESKNLTDFLKP